MVQRDGGASEGAPPTGISTGPYLPVERASSGLAYQQPAAEPASNAASRAIGQQLMLPSPRRMSQQLTLEQQRMRRLATEIGLSFATTSGVKKARLDEAQFVQLFTTLIHRESSFNRLVVSPAGARGLGQLMPATAAELGVCDVFSAEQNLHGAATYLTNMLDQFGTPELALAAYNAGPAAVMKYRGVPPYRETRQYVADILHAVQSAPRERPVATSFDIAMQAASAPHAAGSILFDAAGNRPFGCRTLGLAARRDPSVYE